VYVGKILYQYKGTLPENTSITLPDYTTGISGDTFRSYSSSNLISITIPNSVTSIGNFAFSNCSSLTSITIPDSVTSIGDEIFPSSSNFIAIYVSPGNTNYTSDQDVLYNKDKTTLIRYPAGKSGVSFTIPNSVTSIGGKAFMLCSNLSSITIPNSVTSIGYSAFSSCQNLTALTIPTNKIDTSVFKNCTNLVSVTFLQPPLSDFGSFELGDLSDKYKSGGAGTYTRSPGSTIWTKSL